MLPLKHDTPTGLLVELENSSALAEAIAFLLARPETRWTRRPVSERKRHFMGNDA